MAKNPVFAILWIALLLFLAWPIAGICCGIWLILQVSYLLFVATVTLSVNTFLPKHLNIKTVAMIVPFMCMPLLIMICCVCVLLLTFSLLIIMPQPFEGCFTFVKDITDFLEKLITWPRDCGRAISDCATRCPTPF